jgi:TRAP-type C4-dicarboxylate transport system substrate-binding protein
MNLAKPLALASLAFALACGPALAQQNWKIASAAQPGSVLVGFVDETANKITTGTAGAIKTERLFVGSEQEIIQQLVRGRLEMGSVSYTGASVLIPEAALLNMPYLWRSNAERDFVTDNFALPILKKIYDSKGLVIIGLGEVGWNDVVCKKACLTPNDVKGMKVRVSPAPSSKMFWGSLAVNGVQMPLSELFPALQSGLVEAADLPFSYYITTPAAQSAPHYVMTRHLHHGSTFMVNKKLWDSLSADQKKVVEGARPDVARMRREVEVEEKPKMEEFRKKGGVVHELTAAQRLEWSKLVEPNQERLVKEIGGGAQELWEAIQKGRKEFVAKGGK